MRVFATDQDKTKPNNDIAYFIESGGSDQFTMNGTSGEIRIQVGATLDRERQEEYNLTIIAIDKGVPQNTGSTSVKITLIDIDDTPPKWMNLPRTIHVNENTTKNFKCLANDSDTNPSLVYSMHLEEAFSFKENDVNVSLIQVQVLFLT